MATSSSGSFAYVGKLLRQNFDRLQYIVAPGVGIQADPFSDINAVIVSLYLESKTIESTVLELERLVFSHQILNNQAAIHRKELANIAQQIFWLLGFKVKQTKHQGTVLVVDDVPENIHLLSSGLTKQGYEVSRAINGPMALNGMRTIMPDLILLDIRMLGMDGFEVCQQIKIDPITRDIPILFLSAVDHVLDKVKAFEVGGMDYITKPFHNVYIVNDECGKLLYYEGIVRDITDRKRVEKEQPSQ